MVNQTVFLMRTLLTLKSWRLALMLPIMALMLFGIQCCYKASKLFTNTDVDSRIRILTAENFSSSNAYIIGNMKVFSQEFGALRSILKKLVKTERSGLYEHCTTREDCFSQIVSSMLFNTDKKQRYYTDYNSAMTFCQASYTSMLECAFFWSIVALSGIHTNASENWYDTYHAFQLVSLPDDTETKQASSTICATEKGFFVSLPQLLTLEMSLITPTVCAYILVATVSCMNELKSRGFLQLMMRKGLSPFSYWGSVWILTSFELILLTSCLAASFYLQCPGFYSLHRLLYSSLAIGAHLFCLTAFILLFTVLSNDYYTICKCAFLYIAITVLVTIVNRMAHKQGDEKLGLLRILLLSMPCSNIVEQLQANFVGQMSADVETKFHTVGLIINGSVLAIVGMITLFLDHVLKTGNALCYPVCYVLSTVPGVEALPNVDNTPPCVEVPDLTVFVQVANVSQKVLNANGDFVSAEGSISVDFYNEQITAVYGEDCTKTGSFLGVLTGRMPASRGHVWVDGCIATNPMARPHMHTRVGECPQENTLCHSLTVMHTLRTALVSSDCMWEDYEREVNKVMSLLQLLDKLPCKVRSLSSGQKRKLCIAIALLGNPRLIILNDPTRSLDPLSRMRMWRLLQDYRLNRCVVVSTQFIDDADLFADRKIFLSSAGHLICAGSSAFIRRGLGCGPVVEATLKDKRHGKAVVDRLRIDLPSGASTRVQNSLVSVQLAHDNANLLPNVINSLMAIRKDVSWVGVNHPSLSEAYNRLKSLSAVGVNSLFHKFQDDAAKGEEIKQPHPKLQVSIDVDAKIDPMLAEETFGEPHIVCKEVSNSKSQASCIGATIGIFCFNCLLVRRNCCKLFGRLSLPIVLLLFYAFMLVIEKRSIKLKSTVWTNFSSLAARKFSRGICISDDDIPANHKIDKARCSIFFTGAITLGDNFLSIHKYKRTGLYSFLQHPNQINKLFKHCMMSEPTDLPCPVVYANTWHTSSFNMERQLSVGSISPYMQYDPELAAATTFKAFQTAMNYFSSGLHLRNFKLAAFLDFRNVIVPLYGVFTQIFIITILPVLYLDDVIEHNASKWRSYLISMGVSTVGYWASTLLMHWLQYAVVYSLMVALGAVINPSIYTASQQTVVIGLTITCGLINNLMISYLLCLLFPCSRRTLLVLYLLLTIVISLSTICAQSIKFVSIVMIALLPQFASSTLTLFSVRLHVYSTDLYANVREIGKPKVDMLFQHGYFKHCIMAIPAQTIALIILLLVAERIRAVLDCCCVPSKRGCKGQGTSDIFTREDPLVQEFGDQPDESDAGGLVSLTRTVDMKHARKVYHKRAVQAVRNLTINVNSGETLGLVGPNGSGVTTAVSVIIGNMRPTNGRCQVSVRGSRVSHRRIGSTGMVAYSPQCNPLFATVTADEHLRYYAWMLGASRHKVHKLLKDIGLNDVKNRPVWQLSEGHKRRLSLAICLLSSSPLLVIDDASTGINSDDVPHLWKTIAKCSSKFNSVIISAHSLEGAEAIGSRVALINHGLVAGIGTVHQLRQRYGIYTLELEFESETVEMAQNKKAAILKAIIRRFFSSEILDQSLNWVKISIPVQNAGQSLDSLRWLLKLKDHFVISVLTFYPATTDQLLEFIFKNHDAKVQKLRPSNVKLDATSPAPLAEYYGL